MSRSRRRGLVGERSKWSGGGGRSSKWGGRSKWGRSGPDRTTDRMQLKAGGTNAPPAELRRDGRLPTGNAH